MSRVLETVHRIRKAQEREAQARVIEAERMLAARQQKLESVERDLACSWEAASTGTVGQLAHHHTDALRLEVRRRLADRDVTEEVARTDALRNALTQASSRAKAVGQVVELHTQLEEQGRTRRDEVEQTERSLRSWWRRSA